MSNKITVPLVKYNYALVGIALQLCPQRTRLTPMDRLVIIDILQRLPFSSEGQVIDLDKCADWQIHRSQIARAVGISLRTVSRSIAKIEELGLLNVIRSKTAEGKNKANRFVPMIDKFIEYAVAEDEASVEAAEAVARALDSATKCHQSRSGTQMSLLLQHLQRLQRRQPLKQINQTRPNRPLSYQMKQEPKTETVTRTHVIETNFVTRCQEMRMVSVEKMAASVINLLRQVIQLLRRQMRYGKAQ